MTHAGGGSLGSVVYTICMLCVVVLGHFSDSLSFMHAEKYKRLLMYVYRAL